jgi:raffinose/stachyose/melibiose transport system substrate-binding protein
MADEDSKIRIRKEFLNGAESDVLFFFTGADADAFLDRVVPVTEIREKFPDYARNVDESYVPFAIDGNWYAVPVNGYWENMFVNKSVLNAAGVDVPGTDYYWENFLEDCAKIKNAGYTPIAASFDDVPHYWWEFAVFNNGGPTSHKETPLSSEDETAKSWVAGMNDIKLLYAMDFFPENVLTDKYDTVKELFYSGEAAFMLDGSWLVNTIKSKCYVDGELDEELLSNFTVVNFPAKDEERKSTDMIMGISSGWYISRKAWNDPEKRAACVDFVKFMTSDEMVSHFAGTSPTALKNSVSTDENGLDSLDRDILGLFGSMTSRTSAVQDTLPNDARNNMFKSMTQMLSGKISPEAVVSNFLEKS